MTSKEYVDHLRTTAERIRGSGVNIGTPSPMRVCDDDHEAIVYQSRLCPLCKALDDAGKLKKRMRDLEDKW